MPTWRHTGIRFALGYAAVAAALTVALTWPLFRHPSRTVLEARSLYGDAHILVQRDINLTMWVLAWDTHALTTAPAQLFHGNVFHPAPHALARSEHMLGNVPLFGPVFLATGNPVLAHQSALLATFVLAALAMGAYVFYWTRDPWAAAVGGLLYALAPFRLWQLGNLHVVSIHLLPLVLLGSDLTLDRRARAAGPVVLCAGLLVSGLCSYYVGYQAFLAGAVYAGATALGAGRSGVRGLARLLVPAGVAAVVIGSAAIPYLRLQLGGELPDYAGGRFDSFAFLGLLKEGVRGTLSFFVLPRRDGIPLFLGWTAIALAVVGAAAWRGRPRGPLLAVLASGVLLTLGPRVPSLPNVPLPYEWLATVVPGFSAMRAPQRFGALAALAVMPLAAFGLAWGRARLTARRPRPAWGALVALAALLGFVLEVAPGPLATRPMPVGDAVPAVDRHLAQHGDGGSVLYVPFSEGWLFRESAFMYRSIFHWLPIVNGYSPYPPASYRQIATAAEGLPDPAALDAVLAAARPRWVVLLTNQLADADRARWQATLEARLRLVRRFERALLYEAPGAGREARGVGILTHVSAS